MPVNLTALVQKNNARWDSAQFKPEAMARARRTAQRLCAPAAKARYQHVEKLTGVPWFAIAMIHEREAGQRWDRQLGQGDPLAHVSVHVPKGRGPFNTWEEGAVDALVNCGPYAARWKDWTPGGMLTLQEMYNGLGYAAKGRPSAYIWSGSNQYVSGKYVADGVYDPNVVDPQLGCAVMLKAMMEIDNSIYPAAEHSVSPKAHDTDHPHPDDYPETNQHPVPQAPEGEERDQPPVPTPAPAPVSRTATAQEQRSVTDKANDALDKVEQYQGVFGRLGPIFTLLKSKIAWAAALLFGSNVGQSGVSAQHAADLIHNPMFWIVVGAAAFGIILFFRWYDHGRQK